MSEEEVSKKIIKLADEAVELFSSIPDRVYPTTALRFAIAHYKVVTKIYEKQKRLTPFGSAYMKTLADAEEADSVLALLTQRYEGLF